MDEREAGVRSSVEELRAAGFDVDSDWVVVHFAVLPDGPSALAVAEASLHLESVQALKVLSRNICEGLMLPTLVETDEVASKLAPDMKQKALDLMAGRPKEQLFLLITLEPLSDVDGIFGVRRDLMGLAEANGGRYDDFMIAQ